MNSISITKISLFSVFLFLYLWCYIMVLVTDPGHVPLYFGFRTGSDLSQRKTYCTTCHIYKPDRTHHCSKCEVCVLNFDHHCPWINSCIGFRNWKYFVLMLIYLCILLIVYVASFFWYYVESAVDFWNFLTSIPKSLE